MLNMSNRGKRCIIHQLSMQCISAGISCILSFLAMSLLVLYSTLIASGGGGFSRQNSQVLLRVHSLASYHYLQFIQLVKFTWPEIKYAFLYLFLLEVL